jgi:PAS domain-containing protein
MALVLLPLLVVGAYAIPAVWKLGGSVGAILENNYVSIQSAQHMQDVLRNLQLAESDGHLAVALPGLRDEFFYWLSIENHSITEIDELEAAHDIDVSARRLFDELASNGEGTRHEAEFDYLLGDTNLLIRLNELAMWRNDVRLRTMARSLAYTLILGFLVAIIAGAWLSWSMSRKLTRPLTKLAARLGEITESLDKLPNIGPQRLAELQSVAVSFNEMADRLRKYQQLNIERILFEKKKIESIIEHLEHGVVLVDHDGRVAHLNEIAAIALGLDEIDVNGLSFNSLPTVSRSYTRIRDELGRENDDSFARSVEIAVHLRGRDHSFLVNRTRLSDA